jgi:putative ABC transport system permease protein
MPGAQSVGGRDPYTQSVLLYAALVVRTAIEPESITQAVRTAISEVDKDQPVTGVATMEQIINASAGMSEFRSFLLGIFALLALALAALGVFGVVSFSVTRRACEIGIRIALGATPAFILRSVVRQALGTVLPGVALGVVASFGLMRLISGLLYDVTPTDPVMFGVVSLLLTGIGVLASYLPARRAARIDPAETLRDGV